MRMTVRTAQIAAVLLCLVAGDNAVIAREDVRTMTCDQARELVIKNGAVALTTGPGRFERFVRTRRLCAREEVARVGKAETRDEPQCPVGYICVPRIRNDR